MGGGETVLLAPRVHPWLSLVLTGASTAQPYCCCAWCTGIASFGGANIHGAGCCAKVFRLSSVGGCNYFLTGILDIDISTCPEGLLAATAHGGGAVATDPPAITSGVGPLEDTVVAAEVLGQRDLQGERPTGSGRGQGPDSRAARRDQWLKVQAVLARVLLGTGGGAQLEAKVSLVVCCQVHRDVDSLPDIVASHDCSSGVFSTWRLMLSHLGW